MNCVVRCGYPPTVAASCRANGSIALPAKSSQTPAVLDVDHLIALGAAHRAGGWRWGRVRKHPYANELGDPDHLVAVSAAANRSKGAKGPSTWLPPRKASRCCYVLGYERIAKTWKLTLPKADRAAIADTQRPVREQLTVRQRRPVGITLAPSPEGGGGRAVSERPGAPAETMRETSERSMGGHGARYGHSGNSDSIGPAPT